MEKDRCWFCSIGIVHETRICGSEECKEMYQAYQNTPEIKAWNEARDAYDAFWENIVKAYRLREIVGWIDRRLKRIYGNDT